MTFTETKLSGGFTIDLQRLEDDRGYFARVFDHQAFAEHGLETHVSQCNLSFNHRRGTVRGLHFQAAPHEEVKIVRCTRGAIFDVMVDLRPSSPTFRDWVGVELTADNYRLLYVPRGFAHGYQTLVDDTEVFYQVSAPYSPGSERGIPWNDPALGIDWPLEATVVSKKDRGWRQLEA